jgi:hypothetical protein
MKTSPCQALLHSALLLSGIATLPAHATVAYGVTGSAQAEARDDGNFFNDNHRFYDPNGASEMYWDGLSVKAGTTASAKLGGRQAASISRAWGYSGGVGLMLSSDEQITDTHYYAKSTASAESIMLLNSSIAGTAGSSGQLVLTGETYYSFSGGPYYNGLSGQGYGYGSGGYSVGWSAQSSAPGSGGCVVAACRASQQFGTRISAGSSGGGLVPWRLELTVRAGDDFSFSFRAAAIASAGVGITIDNAAPVPASFRSQAVEGLSAPQSVSNAALTAAGGGPRLWLSPGLSLADTGGLVALGDGSYGFAAPVPEPATGAAMLLGLAALGGLRRIRRSAPRAW